MVYTYRTGVIIPFIQKHYKLIILLFAALFASATLAMTHITNAAGQEIEGCLFEVEAQDVWSLQGDCNATGPINVPANTIVEGKGHTIKANYVFGSNPTGTNTVIGIINADNVTIKDLTIDGSSGTLLHGINVFVSENVLIENVAVMNNDKSGLVVNGSTVTISNFHTSGNGWNGINVDLGSGVTDPAILNIDGPVDQSNETFDIFADNTPVAVTVNDTLGQYMLNGTIAPAELYTWSDVIAPEVEIVSPLDGDVLGGPVTVEGKVSDFVANDQQTLTVRNSSNNIVYSETVMDSDNPALPSFSFDSSDFTDGEYQLVLLGIDEAGNEASDTIMVTFDNYVDNKNECKLGGWQRGVLGGTFHNQGDCVSYFATNGANPATNGATNERANRNR